MRKALTVLALFLLGFPAETRAQQAGGAQEYLNRAADAVLALKSTQFTLNREGAPAFLDEKAGLTFTSAQCKYAAPDRVSCDVKVSAKTGMVLAITRVWVPEGTFQFNPLTKQFAKAPADANFNGVVLFAKTGIPAVLRTAVVKPQVVGRENIQGKQALHLRGEVTGERLNPLMGSTLKPDLMYPVDLWIDEKTANAVQLRVTEPQGNGWLIELFDTNEPVNVPTPQIPPAKPPA